MYYDVSGNLIVGQVAAPVVIIEPTQEPITLLEAKKQCEIDADITRHDTYITALITLARKLVERETGLAMVDQTLELRLDGYPASRFIALTGPLLQTLSFKYTDENGDLQDVDSDLYVTESSLKNVAPRIVPAYNATWPYSIPVSDSLRVQWRAGFVDLTGSPTESMTKIPATLIHAMKLATAHFFADRTGAAQLPPAVQSLCDLERVRFGIA